MTCTKKLRIFALCALLLGGQQSLHAQGTYEEAPFEEEEFKGPNRRSSGNRSQSTFVQGLRFGTKFNFSIYGNEMLYGLEPTIGYQLLEEFLKWDSAQCLYYHNWGGFSNSITSRQAVKYTQRSFSLTESMSGLLQGNSF